MSLDVALTSPNLTTMRTVPHQGRYYLAIAPQTTYATARINQASFDVPLTSITVDTVSANWTSAKAGMSVWIGTSADTHDVGIYRLRATPTSTTLPISELASGDPGLKAVRISKAFADNLYVTIKNDYNLHSVFPKIEYSGGVGTFRKDSVIAYTTQTKTGGAVPGIVNIGEHIAVYVGDGNTYTDARSSSITVFSGSVSTYAWVKDAAGTAVGGSASTGVYDVSYPPGHYIIALTVTLSNGASMTANRHIWVYDDSTYPLIQVQVFSHTINRKGASFTAEIIGSTFPSDLLAGAMVMLWEKTDSTAIASATTKAIGFVETIDGATRPGYGVATISVISPLAIMDKIRGFSQILKAVTGSPTDWHEASTGLMTVDFFCFYILYWHSTLLRLFDFWVSALNFSKYIWKAETGTWLSAINSATALIDCELTQDSHGNLWIKRDPVMMTTLERSSVVQRVTLGEDDIVEGSFGYQRQNKPSYGAVHAYGLSTDTTSVNDVEAFASLAFGGSGGQGMQEDTINRLSTNLTMLQGLVSNWWVKLNNPFPRIGYDLVSKYSLIEPALRYFVPLNITTAQLLPTGEAFNFRTIPEEVTLNYTIDATTGAISKRVSVVSVAETDATATLGVEVAIAARDGYDYTLPTFGDDGLFAWDFDPFAIPDYLGLPPMDSIILDTSTDLGGTPGSGGVETTEAICWGTNSGGKVYYTSDFTAGTVTWVLNGTGGAVIVQAMPAKGSSSAVYALFETGLYDTADVATTPISILTGLSDVANLMRMLDSGDLVIFGVEGGDNVIWIWDGSLSSSVTIGTQVDEVCGDVDDYGLGAIIAASEQQIWFSLTYGGAFTQMTGLPNVTGSISITDIHIPHLKVSGARNNNLSALEFIYSTFRESIVRATYNLNTNTLISSTDLTPTFDGADWGVMGEPDNSSGQNSRGHALETYAGNANRIHAAIRQVSGAAKNVFSLNGGTTWTEIPATGNPAHFLHFVEPIRGGDGNKVWMITLADIFYSDDFWATDDTKDIPSLVAPALPRGVFQL